jgi:hypothetical protein
LEKIHLLKLDLSLSILYILTKENLFTKKAFISYRRERLSDRGQIEGFLPHWKECAMRRQIKKAGGQRRKPDKGAPDIPHQKDILKKT